MKKFLSSLLALTMILSLVIVPAQATVTDSSDYIFNGGVTVTADKTSVESGSNTVNLTATSNLTVTKKNDNSSVTPTLEYSWSEGASQNSSDKNKATVSNLSISDASVEKTYTCTVTYKVDNTAIAERSGSVKITVTNTQKAFENAITSISFNGRTFAVADLGSAKLIGSKEQIDATSFNSNLGKTDATYGTITYTYSGTTLTVKATKDSTELTKQFTIDPSRESSPDFTVKGNNTSTSTSSRLTVVTGQSIALTATGYNGNTGRNISYAWTKSGDAGNLEHHNSANATWTAPELKSNVGDYELTCTITDGNIPTVKTVYVTVIEDKNHAVKDGGYDSYTLTPGNNTVTINVPLISDGKDSASEGVEIVSWVSKNPLVATVTKESNGKGTVTGVRTGSTEVIATVRYNGKPYTKSYTITVKALDVELDSIANGDYESYDDTEFARILANKISDVTGNNFKASDVTSVKLIDSDRYLTFTTDSSNGPETKNLYQDFRIKATKGYLGDQSFKVSVNNKYTVTLTLTVVGAGSTIKDTVSGTAANKDVTFTNSDYKYLYYTTSKVNDNYNDYFNGDGVTGWGKADKNKTVTVKASEFNSNKTVTLNVVGVDSEGYASTGTITVSQKSYDINYNVVAGKSVNFDQKAFEDFMKDYAQDNGDWTTSSRQDYPYVDFDHVELSSIPTAKSEGTLY